MELEAVTRPGEEHLSSPLEDDDLAAIRNRGRSFRPLGRIDDAEVDRIILLNFGLPLGALALVGLTFWARRRTRRPLI